MSTFGERLARLIQLRQEQGVYKSEAAFARHLGISARRLNYYKDRSQPDYDMLGRICEALKTHPNYLLGWSDSIEPRYQDHISKIDNLQDEITQLRKALRAFMARQN